MCRWFVYISPDEPCLLEDVLTTPRHGLANQVNEHYLPKLFAHEPDEDGFNKRQDIKARNMAFNIDGLGMAWYTSARSEFTPTYEGPYPALYKTVSPPLNDFNYRSLCQHTTTKTLFAHIRAASSSLVTPVNNHPFVFGRHCFMHNGTVSNFLEIRREVNHILDHDSFANIQGSTDSETIAALYMTLLTRGRGRAAWESKYNVRDMAGALLNAVRVIIETQKRMLGVAARPNSLNLAVSDGTQLVVFRFRNHRYQQPPSLYYSTIAGVTLNRKYPRHANGPDNQLAVKLESMHGKHLIVSSEPTTYDEKEWELIDKNCVLMFSEDGEFEIEDIRYDEKWNAEDPPQ